MIARLSVAAGALDDLTDGQPVSVAKSQHDTLVRALEAHGLLVFANADEERELVAAARRTGMPPGVKHTWLAVLAELKKRQRVLQVAPPASHGLAAIATSDELRRHWRGRADVAVVPSRQATALGADEHGLLQDARAEVEVAAAPMAANCATIRGFRDLADHGVLACHEPRELFWEQVLQPIARRSRQVTILDPYLFATASRRHAELCGASDSAEPEAVVWLLRKLDGELRQGARVTLVGGVGRTRGPRDAADAARIVTGLWQPPPTGRLVEAIVVLDQVGRSLPHDRHIRFSAGAAVKVLAGFDRLREPTVWDADGMGWQYHWKPAPLDALRSAERRVADGPTASCATLLDRRG